MTIVSQKNGGKCPELPSNDGGPLFRTFPLSHLYSAEASDKNLIFVRK